MLLGADDRRGTGAWDQPGVHDIFRNWRTVADSYDGILLDSGSPAARGGTGPGAQVRKRCH